MTEQILEVHSTKLLYATIKKMLAIIDDYNSIKTALTYYFPNISLDNTEWVILRNNCISFIDKSTNWTGSSPSNDSPDYIKTKTLPQINDDIVTHIYNRLNGNVTFGNDSVIDFDGQGTWTNVLAKFLQVLDLEEKYSMHKQILGGLTGIDENIDKTPGQLSTYSSCEMPLNIIKANTYAFSDILGGDIYCSYLPVYDLNTASNEITSRFNTIITSVATSGSPYVHSAVVGCVLSIDCDTDISVTYDNKYTTNYDSDGSLVLMRLLELHSDVEEVGGDPLTPIITYPLDGDTVISPIIIQTNSLEISGGGFDYHEWTTWQIADSSDFSNILWSSEEDRSNLTEIVITDPENYLSLSSTYYIRVKQYGTNSGRTDWSDDVEFNTASTWDCTVGTISNGGIFAGMVNDKCIVVSKFEAEPSYTNDFSDVSTESEQLSGSASIGDMVYRDDEDLYYVNETGNNADMADWIQIDVQDEPNYEMFADSESTMLSLEVSGGNICVRTDESKCYVNKDGTNTAMSDWIEIDTPVKIWWIAEDYCSQLEENGYTDWRLPISSELDAIQENMITIDSADSTGSFNVYGYWSSTDDVINEKYKVWVEDFNDGTHTTKDRDSNWFYVRAVRNV